MAHAAHLRVHDKCYKQSDIFIMIQPPHVHSVSLPKLNVVQARGSFSRRSLLPGTTFTTRACWYRVVLVARRRSCRSWPRLGTARSHSRVALDPWVLGYVRQRHTLCWTLTEELHVKAHTV